MKQKTLLLTNIVYFIILCLFIGVRILSASVDFGLDDTWQDIIYTAIIQVGILFLLPLFAYKGVKRKTFKQTFIDTKVKPVNPKIIILAIIIGVAAFFLNLAVSSFFSGIIGLFGYETVPGYSGSSMTRLQFIISIFTVALLPAICEEFTHRGFLMSGYSSLGLKRAVVFSSVMFGLMHLNINQVFYAIILGFLMAITVIMSGSIIPSIIIHFINNLINVYLQYAQANGLWGHNFLSGIDAYFNSLGPIAAFLVSFLALVLVLVVILILFIMLLKETRIKKINKLYKDLGEATGAEPNLQGDYVSDLAEINRMLAEYKIQRPTDLVFTSAESRFNKPNAVNNVIFYSTLFLGIVVTIFTFVWGIL